MATGRRSSAPPAEEPKARPVMSFGPYPTDRNTSIEAAVWQNEIESGDSTFTTFNVTIKRSYRTEGGEWKANQNYRPHDLPVLVHALQKCHDFILEKKNPANAD